jgi:hypothetical protein
MNEFVELNDEIGVPRANLGVAVANARNSIDAVLKQEKKHWNQLKTHCVGGNARFLKLIKKIQNALTASSHGTNKAKASLTKLRRRNRNNAIDLQKARASLQEISKRREKVILDYKVYEEEADKKIVVVKALTDIVTDELFNKSPSSLVQVNEFSTKLKELKDLLSNSKDSIYSPIISTLLELSTSETNFSDQAILHKIHRTLISLAKSLASFRKKQEDSFHNDLKVLGVQSQNTRSRVRVLKRIIALNASSILRNQHLIGFYEHETRHLNSEHLRLKQNQHLFGKICGYQERVHRRLKANSKAFRKSVIPFLFNDLQKLD